MQGSNPTALGPTITPFGKLIQYLGLNNTLGIAIFIVFMPIVRSPKKFYLIYFSQ